MPSGWVGSLPDPSSVTVEPDTDTSMWAVGAGVRRSFHTMGVDASVAVPDAAHFATTSFFPGWSLSVAPNASPFRSIFAPDGCPLTSIVTTSHVAVPVTRSVHANASPARESNEITGFSDGVGEGSDVGAVVPVVEGSDGFDERAGPVPPDVH